MPFNAEALLERARLKSRLRRWRLFSIVLLALLGALLANGGVKDGAPLGKDYIALVPVEGFINPDRDMLQTIDDIASDGKVKAVLLQIDSPGGTAVGGEALYEALMALKAKKPIVAVFGNMATSAAYLIAMPADYIVARKASITGSIGALVQVPNVKQLADKVGVTMDIIKTGELKGEPSPLGTMSEASRQMLQGMVDDFQGVFVDAIAKNRKLPVEQVQAMANGRVFTGQQAVINRLVDAIGGEKEAVRWLEDNNKVAKGLEVFEVELDKPEKTPLQRLMGSSIRDIILPKALSFNGLLSIWEKGGM